MGNHGIKDDSLRPRQHSRVQFPHHTVMGGFRGVRLGQVLPGARHNGEWGDRRRQDGTARRGSAISTQLTDRLMIVK